MTLPVWLSGSSTMV